MGLAKKDAPALYDLGDCHDIFTNGIAKIEFLPGNCVRLICHVYEDDRRTVVAKCVWPIEELADAAEQLLAEMARRGYVRRNMARAN